MSKNQLKFVFFGGEPLGVPVLEELSLVGLLPKLIITNPDKPVGRKQVITPPPVKVWASKNNIEVLQPETYKNSLTREILTKNEWDLFVVVAYSFILPTWLLNIPKHGTINLHPSMLPKLRGASPIRTAILNDLREDIGITIMLMDEKMDHGPILYQKQIPISDKNWPMAGPELDNMLAHAGGLLLPDVINFWVDGKIEPQEQLHDSATYCNKFSRIDSEIHIDPKNLPTGKDAWDIWLKINAFSGIGDTFFEYNKKRVKIKKAELTKGQLRLIHVIPEGKKEIAFENFLQSIS